MQSYGMCPSAVSYTHLVGAGTGRYSVALANEGYDVTAVELVKYNLGILKSKGDVYKRQKEKILEL